MKKNMKSANLMKSHQEPPRFLFFLKRRRFESVVEESAKESSGTEFLAMIACGLVLIGIVVLIVRVLGQHAQ
jgi:hypothetical protein